MVKGLRKFETALKNIKQAVYHGNVKEIKEIVELTTNYLRVFTTENPKGYYSVKYCELVSKSEAEKKAVKIKRKEKQDRVNHLKKILPEFQNKLKELLGDLRDA